jgi:hypothetical protein
VAHSFRTGTDWAAKGKDVIRLQHPIVRNPGHDYALRKNGCRHRRLRAAMASGYPIRPASSVFRIPVTGTSRWRRVASHGLSLMSAIPPIVSSGIDTRPRGRGILSSPVAKRMKKLGYSGYRFPPGIIYQAIWLYLRFTLSLRDVEDLLAARGVALSYETVRRWVNRFGPMIAADLRKRRRMPHGTWYLDEVDLKIDGRMTSVERPPTQVTWTVSTSIRRRPSWSCASTRKSKSRHSTAPSRRCRRGRSWWPFRAALIGRNMRRDRHQEFIRFSIPSSEKSPSARPSTPSSTNTQPTCVPPCGRGLNAIRA